MARWTGTLRTTEPASFSERELNRDIPIRRPPVVIDNSHHVIPLRRWLPGRRAIAHGKFPDERGAVEPEPVLHIGCGARLQRDRLGRR
jgi:hypothetical protein